MQQRIRSPNLKRYVSSRPRHKARLLLQSLTPARSAPRGLKLRRGSGSHGSLYTAGMRSQLAVRRPTTTSWSGHRGRGPQSSGSYERSAHEAASESGASFAAGS
jgi:hypothetical protein